MILKLFLYLITSISAQVVPDVIISTGDISQKLYNPKNLRDPMTRPSYYLPVTLNYQYAASTQNIVSVFSPEDIILTGIIKVSNTAEALLKSKTTGQMYIVRNGKVYTINKKPVEGYSARIESKKVILYDINKKMEFVLFIPK